MQGGLLPSCLQPPSSEATTLRNFLGILPDEIHTLCVFFSSPPTLSLLFLQIVENSAHFPAPYFSHIKLKRVSNFLPSKSPRSFLS